ncbi:MAG: TonB-dependent receptor plug domain-containing protein, partial [Alteraurantiacibacter sp.]|nr:TonB-dependent receptor plug domain-containing protein [Alteraurantiacibacter sp.]
MIRSIACFRGIILSASALTLSLPAHAADEAQRDYLGNEIVVTAARDSYVAEDGYTATKTPTPLINVPQAVTVITADQIEDQALRTLNDALRYVTGVSLGTGEGHRDQIVLRGQSTTADFY